MSWISLVCLLALTSSALGRSAFGSGYGTVSVPQPVLPRVFPTVNPYETVKTLVPPVQTGYGSGDKLISKTLTGGYGGGYGSGERLIHKTLTGGYGSSMVSPPVLPRTLEPVNAYSYGSQNLIRDLTPVAPVLPPTQAELLCRGAEAGVVIPIEGNRKFVICIGDDKGYEQECPKGLYYHPESRRCERRLGPLENACISQPCLNGGQCIPDGSSFQCQCAANFDGKTCELDATTCQTQWPCGQSPDVRCQSFRLGAALPYVCLFQDSTAYGLSQQQIFPSPCGAIDGPQRLAFGNKGFILCDGERLFVESCPGGTIWDDFNKACAWPDQEGVVAGPILDSDKDKSLGADQMPISQNTYGSYGTYTQPMPLPVPVPTMPKIIERPTGYGVLQPTLPKLPKLLEESTSYGGSYATPAVQPLPKFTPSPRVFETTTPSYGGYTVPSVPVIPRIFETTTPSSYGGYTVPSVPVIPRIFETTTPSSYGGYTAPTVPFIPRIFETTTPSYGGYAVPTIPFTPAPPTQPKIIERPTNYGSRLIPEPMKPRFISGY